MSADWEIGKLFYHERDCFLLPTEELAEGEDGVCSPGQVSYVSSQLEAAYEGVYHIPAKELFMVLYGQDGSNVVKVLYQDKIGWLDFGTCLFVNRVW